MPTWWKGSTAAGGRLPGQPQLWRGALQHRPRNLPAAGAMEGRLAGDPGTGTRDPVRRRRVRRSWRATPTRRRDGQLHLARRVRQRRSWTAPGCTCACPSSSGRTWPAMPGQAGDPTAGRRRWTRCATRRSSRVASNTTTFEASTALSVPVEAGTEAGIAAFQNETHWYFLGVRRNGEGTRTVPGERQRRRSADASPATAITARATS